MKKALVALHCFWLGVSYNIRLFLTESKRVVWNRGVKLQWYRLWIRENEFHNSLEWDVDAVLGMSLKQRHAYEKELKKRRHIAHERDLMKKSPAFRAIVMNRKTK